MMLYLCGDDLRMQRSACFVDIAAVRAGMRNDDLAAEIGEELRRNGRRGSIGAVDDNATAIEREPWNGSEQEADVLSAVGLIDPGGTVCCGGAVKPAS